MSEKKKTMDELIEELFSEEAMEIAMETSKKPELKITYLVDGVLMSVNSKYREKFLEINKDKITTINWDKKRRLSRRILIWKVFV